MSGVNNHANRCSVDELAIDVSYWFFKMCYLCGGNKEIGEYGKSRNPKVL